VRCRNVVFPIRFHHLLLSWPPRAGNLDGNRFGTSLDRGGDEYEQEGFELGKRDFFITLEAGMLLKTKASANSGFCRSGEVIEIKGFIRIASQDVFICMKKRGISHRFDRLTGLNSRN
jgi:hypothetical protein